MGLVTAIRFLESVYRSSIVGLQRQVLFNVVNSVMATIRGLGAVGVLVWVSASIEVFFIWQGLVSITTVIVFAMITYASLPCAERAGCFSIEALRGWRCRRDDWHYLSIAPPEQVDKVLLSKCLRSVNTATTHWRDGCRYAIHVISPITQAWYPRLCELYSRSNQALLIETYHQGTQLVSVIAGSVAIVMILFSETFLRLWTQDHELAKHVAPLLSLLILGNLLNGLMWVPYQTQLAHGWTTLALNTNIIAVVIIVPAILWVTPRYGTEGAAWVWASLNAGYVLIGIHFMYRHILSTEKWCWYRQDLIAPLGAATLVAAVIALLWPWPDAANPLTQLTQLALAALSTLSAALLSANRVRTQALGWLRHIIFKWKTAHA